MHARSRTCHAFALTACAAFALITLTPAAHAQTTYFPNDATLNATNPVTGYAVVGYANANDAGSGMNATSPIVRLVNGGSVSRDLSTYGGSTVNISGGSVSGVLYAHVNSAVNVSGGSVGGDLNPDGNSTINISGGSIGGSLRSQAYSTVNMSGGHVNGVLEAYGFDTLFGQNVVNISGGSVGSEIRATNKGILNFFGTGLSATLVNSNYFSYGQYSLSGTLLDGTVLANRIFLVQSVSGARFTLNNVAAVPEPGSVALLVGLMAVGASLLRKRRARK